MNNLQWVAFKSKWNSILIGLENGVALDIDLQLPVFFCRVHSGILGEIVEARMAAIGGPATFRIHLYQACVLWT